MVVRSGAELLNIQRSWMFWRQFACSREFIRLQLRLADEVVQQLRVRFLDRDQGDAVAVVRLNRGREKSVAAGPEFPVLVSAVRTDPKNSVPEPGCALQVRFGPLRIDLQESGKLD